MTVILMWVGTLCLLASGFLFFQSRRLSEQLKDLTKPLKVEEREELEQRSNRIFMTAFALFVLGVACKILTSYPRALDSLHKLLNMDP